LWTGREGERVVVVDRRKLYEGEVTGDLI